MKIFKKDKMKKFVLNNLLINVQSYHYHRDTILTTNILFLNIISFLN